MPLNTCLQQVHPARRPAGQRAAYGLDQHLEYEGLRSELLDTLQDLERSNEALLAANQELQSLWHDIAVLNRRLEYAQPRQQHAAMPWQNVLESLDITALILDANLNIQFFTSTVESVFNIISSDIGRPLQDLSSKIANCSLLDDARAVLQSQEPIIRDIQNKAGTRLVQKLRPYGVPGEAAAGVVITFASQPQETPAIAAIPAATNPIESLAPGLTPRQREIMDLVLAGRPSKVIAGKLGVSQRTVESHRAAIMKKTGARSLPELARLAFFPGNPGNYQNATA
jgi:DNA-binding CsgD family transcriptional regulator